MVFQLCGAVALGKPKKKLYEITWVRGRIERQGKPNYPIAKIAVSLVPRAYITDASRTIRVYTGEDGMFDFKVAPGTYVLKVWYSEKQSKDFLIVVKGQRYLDIAPIVIPQ